jgi:hypothetical protein
LHRESGPSAGLGDVMPQPMIRLAVFLGGLFTLLFWNLAAARRTGEPWQIPVTT